MIRLMKPPRLELYSFLFSMPLIAVVLNLILFEQKFWQDIRVWTISTPLLLGMGTITWYFHVLYSDAMERKYPSLNQSRQRIMRKALVTLFVMTPAIMTIFFIYDSFHILGYQLHSAHLFKGLLVGLSVNLIFETLYEADYMMGKYRESVEERETLQELSVHHEFDALKSQVNPHFLFNCFNTLSSLISEDKEKAEVFLDELSKVYRYLLRNNEEGLSTLENEIKFIQSYYKLLQTRHGDAVRLNLQIDKGYESYLLPSLTLQLLVENVVKHNSLSKNKPLIIDIFTLAGNKLVVNNNLQRRVLKAPSNKVGLENIKTRYELLKQPGFQVIEDEKNFTVVLPLVWKNQTSAFQRPKQQFMQG